jgi:uncharacterized protein
MLIPEPNHPATQFEMEWKAATDPKEGKWPGLRPNEIEKADGMEITWDVAVTLRDGIKTYVDIFRPESSDGPIPIILTYSPYGKHGPKTFDMFPNSGVPKGSVSKYAVWEGPDPLYWTKEGYAVINADARGSWGSEGNCEILSSGQGQDGYDIVEWAAKLPWSNGRVGLCGVSYLAIIQWRVAELNPPHLACIMPWEGFSDVYRDYGHHGGIPETNFIKFMEWSCRCGFGKIEDWVNLQHKHHLLDEYQETKRAKLSQIKVPAYVVADWGDQGLHTRGSLYGFSTIASEAKWLEVHGRKKWQYFYQESSLRRQGAFFKKFLRNRPSETDSWPRVQIEIRDRALEGTVRSENEWPIKRTRHVFKYLDAFSSKLTDVLPQSKSTLSYNSTLDGDHVHFTYTFTEETELTGSMRLRIWVSTDTSDDMDIFVQVDKLDGSYATVPFVSMSMIDNGPLALGWLRVSHRELDTELSSIDRPWLRHQRELKLRKDEVVPVDIEIWPSSTRFLPGESLKLTIQGSDIFKYELAQVQLHQDSVNSGRHFVYTGGIHDSYLVFPVVDTAKV